MTGASVTPTALVGPEGLEPHSRLHASHDIASADYAAGWNAALGCAAAIAERWRDENKAARDSARVRGMKRSRWDGDETHLVMAEQLDGAMIECNAIAEEIRKLSKVQP